MGEGGEMAGSRNGEIELENNEKDYRLQYVEVRVEEVTDGERAVKKLRAKVS